MQARKAIASEAIPAAAAAEEQHEEPGGALSHLISMYGASQEASHDDSDSTSPKGNADAAGALDSGSGPVLAMPAGQGVGDHPVHEGPSQPAEAIPAANSIKQEHDKRVDDRAGGEEVAEQAVQQAQRAEQPPPEVQGIVAKLLAFVKVRLSPLVPLWSRDVLWCSGALKDDCWRMLLAAAV